MKTFIAIASAALLCAAADSAYAQLNSDVPTARISYADLDLSRPAGRQILEQRVSGAIKRMCPARPAPQELMKMRQRRECHQTAWAGANRQLAQIYGGRHLADGSVLLQARAD